VIGREGERVRVEALLEAARRGRTGVLVVAGEPGIGKTTLLDDACARVVGMRVLKATGVESESTLPFAGLHALLRPLLPLLERLDEPQQRALAIALALRDGEDPEILAVNAGTLSLLAEAAAERPLLVAIDDVHWLDQPSADALAFAARRLATEDLAFLVTVRTAEPSVFDRGFERLELDPLGPDAARAVLSLRREPVAGALADVVLELSSGNPLALLELPAPTSDGALDLRGTVSDRLRSAFAARLTSLPAPARHALAVAAAESDVAVARSAAAFLGIDGDAFAAAEAEGLVRLEVDGIAFRHPLVRSLAYGALEPAERRDIHRALATALVDDADRDRRAWHLAAAATEPDETLAALLEETADRAAARGGHTASAQALELASRLSVGGADAARRLSAAARAFFWAGRPEHALELAQRAATMTDDATARADALLELASIQGTRGCAPADLDVLDLDGLDPDRATRFLILAVGEKCGALEVAAAAELLPHLEAVARRAGPWWKPRGLGAVASTALAAGDSGRFAAIVDELRGDDVTLANYGLDLIWAECYELARHALESTLQEGRESGNQMRVIWNQGCLSYLECRVGRFGQARLAAAEAITLGDAHGTAAWAASGHATMARLHAWQGDATSCRASADVVLDVARESGLVIDELGARAALGLLALGLGRSDEAIDVLEPAFRRWWGSTMAEPSAAPFVPDLVEAYAQRGDAPAGHAALEAFAAAAERADRRWARAAAARCRGILAPADMIDGEFEDALDLLEATPLELDRARTHLAYGERLRRAGRRRDARPHLRAAHDAFALVDAAPWAARAAAELRATGEIVGPRSPDRASRLTPQEVQIARLVAEGLTNKEIAGQLYLSPKTIEYHLGNAYRKLDVHSRTELVRVLATDDAVRV
jgi:DNA-binding CsgD family transcriptional regulator